MRLSISNLWLVKHDLLRICNGLRKKGVRRLLQSHADPGLERYRRAGITASASLIQRGFTVAISLLSVPLTIHYLGPERYGVWLTISSLLVWMALTDFGVAGNALVNVLSEADGNDDRVAAQQYASSAVWTLLSMAALMTLAAVIGFPFVPWSKVFRVSTIPPHELNMACALTLGFFILALPLSIQNSIYSAYQEGFLSNICGIAMNVATLIALLVVTLSHRGLPHLVLALFGARVAVGIGSVYYIFFRRYPWLLPLPSAVRWHCVRRLFRLGGKYMLTQLGSFGMTQSQPIIITQILGPASVIAFVLAQRVITLPMEIIYMSTAPLVPAFGEARTRSDWGWIRQAYRNVTLASLAFGVPILIGIAFIARPVIRVWAGPAAVPNIAVILWLTLYNIIGVALMATGQLLIGVERVDALTVSIVLCALATVVFGAGFCYWTGLSGIAMAMALSKLITFWPLQLSAARRVFSGIRHVKPISAASEGAA